MAKMANGRLLSGKKVLVSKTKKAEKGRKVKAWSNNQLTKLYAKNANTSYGKVIHIVLVLHQAHQSHQENMKLLK